MTSVSIAAFEPVCAWLEAHGTSCFEMLGFVTGVLNVWLVTRQSLWSWPIGIINAAVYAFVFASAGLYSDTGLQIVYFGLSIYGWWHWWRGQPSGAAERAPLPVTPVPRALWPRLIGVTMLTWIVLATITIQIPTAVLPWFDAALVSSSLVAQWMMTRKLRECWLVWIVIDLSYVVLFLIRDLRLTAVLYFLFFALAVRGHIAWTRSMRASNSAK
ncbi:MAG: nicotinamide mononucleotide transporter [Gemmatimonadaceae bacterium]|nr:nicotinamide mononucleotide transporter [Gemmatimonadaceae bacterium]